MLSIKGLRKFINTLYIVYYTQPDTKKEKAFDY